MITHDKTISETLNGRTLRAATVYELDPPTGLASESLSNGDFELWTGGASDADDWTETGTVAQDASVFNGGLYSARLSTGASVAQSTEARVGKWYHVSGYTRWSVPSGSPELRLHNATTGDSWNATTNAWEASATYNDLKSLSGNPAPSTWFRFSIWFQWDSTAATTDLLTVTLRATGTGNSWFDDVSLIGPHDRAPLFYASRNITWNNQTYTPQVLKVSEARDTMKLVQSRITMTIGNAQRPMRQYLDPVDTFTGGVLRCRIVFMDSSFNVDDDRSLIYWQGIMRRPSRGDDKSITVEAVGKINPRKVPTPSRRLTTWCQVREFADGVDCGYTSSTTAVGAGVNSTALTTAGALPATADGEYITVGNGDKVLIASGGGTTSLTLAEARSWSNGDAVAYADCDRQWERCLARQRTHEFQGFRAVRESSRFPNSAQAWEWVTTYYPWVLPAGFTYDAFVANVASNTAGGVTNASVVTSPDDVVPIIFGRRWTSGSVTEELLYTQGETAKKMNTRFVVLSEGQINDIREARAGDDRFEHTIDPDDPNGIIHGYYWRAGDIGVASTETVGTYQATPLFQQRAQTIDHRTTTATTLSRTAYAIVLVWEEDDTYGSSNIKFDVEGIKLQKYLADGSTDGSPTYTGNPLWAAVQLATTKRYALRLDPSTDLDFAVIKPEADYCDEVLTSTLGTTVTIGAGSVLTAANSGSSSTTLDVTGGVIPAWIDDTLIQVGASSPVRVAGRVDANTITLAEERSWSVSDAIKYAGVEVDTTEGFARGQLVDVGADANLPVYRILTTNVIELEDPIDWATGEVVQGRVPRFEIAYELKRKTNDAMDALKNIFIACRGYATQDHQTGKVQFRVERGNVLDITTNGSFDDWTADAPDSWTEVNSGVGSSIITEETTIVRTAGGSSCKFEKTSAHTMHVLQTRTGLEPGNWYLLSFWVYTDTAGRAIGARIDNNNTSEYWEARPSVYSTVPTWITTAGGERSVQENITRTNTWIKVVMPFYWQPTYTTAQTCAIRVYCDLPTSPNLDGNVYVDDLKVEGPLAGYYRDSDDVQSVNEEWLTNGSLDDWTVGVADGWSETTTGGSVAEETTVVRTAGGSSAKLIRSGAGECSMSQVVKLLPGRQYRLSFWHYVSSTASPDLTDAPKIAIAAIADSRYLQQDGSWSGSDPGGINPINGGLPGAEDDEDRWIQYTVDFTADTTIRADADVTIKFYANDVSLTSVYVDDVSLIGPIDRTPLTQPGQGIIASSFKWANDDEKRKDINQYALTFNSQALEGARDEAVENDFDDQKSRGYVKRQQIRTDAVGHPDLASRIVKTMMQKSKTLGPGGEFEVGWHGMLIQPGEVIAVRHDNPEWYGDLFRVTKRETLGLGKSNEFSTKITVEDYDADVYTDASRRPTFGLSFTNAALELTADTVVVAGANVGSVRGIRLSWIWDNQQIGITGYTIHKGTTNGFAPTSSTRLPTGERVDRFTRSFTYEPTVDEIGTTLYFKVVATGRGRFVSNQASALVTSVTVSDIDPGLTDDTMPFNLVYDGDFNDPSNWNANGSIVTSNVVPTDDFAGTGGANNFVNRNLAYDLDSDTASTGTCTFVTTGPGSNTFTDVEGTWSWESATPATKTGKVSCIVSMTWDTGDGQTNVEYSTDGGSTYTFIGAVSPTPSTGTTKFTIEADVFDIDISLLRVRIRGYPGFAFQTNTSHEVSVWEVRFIENTSVAILASVAGGVATLEVNSGTIDASVYRKFPGSDPGSQFLLAQNDTYVVRLRAVYVNGVPDDDVRVKLYDNGANETVLMTIPASEITSNSQEFAALFTASADLVGLFDIAVETGSSNPIVVDRLCVQEGTQITQAVTSVEEQLAGTYIDKQAGVTGNFDPGPWDGTNVKKATVT